MSLAQQLQDFVEQNDLFSPNENILLAVSGGRDSVLMAHLFKQAGFSFGIAHCNFNLRTDAVTDEQFTSQLAKQLNVPFYCVQFYTADHASANKISVQMAARDLRYEWLEKIRSENNYDHIALAHHRDDSAETVLLNMVRGTGIAGVHGILPKRGRLVRPLLFLGRADIDQAVEQENIAYRDDESNFSGKYTRNKIRLEVIPRLEEINPNAIKAIEQTARRLADAEEFIATQIDILRVELFRKAGKQIHINLASLKEASNFVLFELFKPYGFSATTLADLRSVWHKQSGARFYSDSHQLVLDRDKLVLTDKDTPQHPVTLLHGEGIWSWGHTSFTAHFAGNDIPFKPNPGFACIDAAKLVFPLSIRSWQTGDFIVPLGMQGKKKLSDLFIDHKIALNDKPEIPVVVNGNGEVIWVCGLRFSELYKIGPSTEKVFILEKL